MLNPKDVNFKKGCRILIAILILAMTFLAGCQGLAYLDENFPNSNATSDATSVATQTATDATQTAAITTITPQVTETETVTPGISTLTIWVPPQFNPNDTTNASRLLADRFKAFMDEHPDVNLNVRIKAASGAGSILDTLDYADQVAVDALPDLVLLSRSDLETAVQEGLLKPIEEVSSTIDQSDWYGFAQDMGIVQGTVYGLPFAADALALVYRNAYLTSTQPNWTEVNSQINGLVFPAGDPTAITPLAIYLSAGGTLQDSKGQASIDVDMLTQTLQIMHNGLKSGLFTNSLLNLQSDDQAWDSFENSSTAEGIITWSSRQLQDTTGLKLALLPSFGVNSYTLARGWVWCLVAHDQEKDNASLLLEYLVDPDFLKSWAPASGYLPVRPSSLAAWENPVTQDTLGKILDSAQLRPNPNQITTLNNGIKTAVQEVLSGQSQPKDSAKKAADSLEVVE